MRKIIISLVLVFLLTSCGASSKSRAKQWADRFPSVINSASMEWELDDDRTELTAENQSNYGYITLTYEGDDDINAYVTIIVYANENAADVALEDRLLDYQVQGARFERERVQGTPFDVTSYVGGYLAVFQADETVVMLRIIAEDPATPLPSEDDIEVLLEIIADIADNID